MGIEYYYANEDKKEYISTDGNAKYPVDQAACALLELLRDRWNGDRIRVYADSGDLPWDDYMPGHEAWKAVDVQLDAAFGYLVLGYPSTNNDPEDAGKYIYIRVIDDRKGDHQKLLTRVMSALKETL